MNDKFFHYNDPFSAINGIRGIGPAFVHCLAFTSRCLF